VNIIRFIVIRFIVSPLLASIISVIVIRVIVSPFLVALSGPGQRMEGCCSAQFD